MKLFIPWICYNHTVVLEHSLCFTRLLLYCQANSIPVTVYPIGFESLISRARNSGVAAFLADKTATHLLFIDSDIEFQPEDVMKLIFAKKDIVCGGYAKKYLDRGLLKKFPDNLELCTSPNVSLFTHQEPSEVMECAYTSTGFLCIQRNVFETLIEKFPERKYKNTIDGYMSIEHDFYDFFYVHINPETSVYESEDYGFSLLARQAGFTIHCLTNITLVHHGWMGFPCNMYQQMLSHKSN